MEADAARGPAGNMAAGWSGRFPMAARRGAERRREPGSAGREGTGSCLSQGAREVWASEVSEKLPGGWEREVTPQVASFKLFPNSSREL